MQVEETGLVTPESQEMLIKELELRKASLYEEIESLIEKKENLLCDLQGIEEKANLHRSICEEVSKLELQRENLMEDCGRLSENSENLKGDFETIQSGFEEISSKTKVRQREYLNLQDAIEELEKTYTARSVQYDSEMKKKELEIQTRGQELKQLYQLILKAKNKIRNSLMV